MAAEIKGRVGQTTPETTNESQAALIRALRDGSLVTANWKQAAALQGLGYMFNVGAFSTPIIGGGNGTILDIDQPEALVSVPSGTSIMPIRCEFSVLTPLLATDADESEVLLGVDQDAKWAVDGTYTSETIYNMNTLVSKASACTAISACSADLTDPVIDIELMHQQVTGDVNGTAANALWGKLYALYQPEVSPVINGPAMLLGYWGGTVATYAFATFQWIEFPTSFLAL